ncbi:MAG: GDSL-type esterase/lipase family protein [Actinobacteria bacterium]|nr:GDSL-type esterase/lipase family protein [Actinomycetota bacterium]
MCTPSPCLTPADHTTQTLIGVSNADGTTSTRSYAVLRPQNLVASSTNLAPAVLVFYSSGTCGLQPAGRWVSLAAPDRFVVVAMEVPCGRDDNWDKGNVNSPTPVVPNDEPYVAAVVHDITQCPSQAAAANQCVDPQRIYAVGLSSGGNMVADIMCDSANSSLFRGYMIDSSSVELYGGQPDCPSQNADYFVMMAIGNAGPDAGIYYGTAPSPHLNAPQFADWAATKLACQGSRIDSMVGSPVASTFEYTYQGPCAFAAAGSPAVITLGVQNGSHGWNCQDSDPGAAPDSCPGMPTPPGLDSSGRPRTNGLFTEAAFWSFVAQGESSTATTPGGSAPPAGAGQAELVSPAAGATVFGGSGPPAGAGQAELVSPAAGATVSGVTRMTARVRSPSSITGVRFTLDGATLASSRAAGTAGTFSVAWDTTTARNGRHVLRAITERPRAAITKPVAVTITVHNPSSGAGSTWSVVGDGFASGQGTGQYLAGTDTSRDRCHRSLSAYPYLAGPALRISVSKIALHACDGALVADFQHRSRRDRDAPQLRWARGARRFVSVTIGWDDARLPAVIQSCGRDSSQCVRRWRRPVQAALTALGGRSSADRSSLYRLYRALAASARHARVLALGYPRPLPPSPPPVCRPAGGALAFQSGAMRWIDSVVARLDTTIRKAAAAAHIRYASGSLTAFAGHEACTRRSDLDATFYPNAGGELMLARLAIDGL